MLGEHPFDFDHRGPAEKPVAALIQIAANGCLDSRNLGRLCDAICLARARASLRHVHHATQRVAAAGQT